MTSSTLINFDYPNADEQARVYHWFRQQTWSEEAYLQLAERSNLLFEYADGQLLILPMPTSEHQAILLEFATRAKAWLKEHNAGKVLVAAHPIRLWPGRYREPDIMIWTTAHLHRIGQRESDPPDLVLEILSPSNPEHDTDTKLREYAQADIPEYWIVNPEHKALTIYLLQDDRYHLHSHVGQGEVARSVILPGFEVAVDVLFPAH